VNVGDVQVHVTAAYERLHESSFGDPLFVDVDANHARSLRGHVQRKEPFIAPDVKNTLAAETDTIEQRLQALEFDGIFPVRSLHAWRRLHAVAEIEIVIPGLRQPQLAHLLFKGLAIAPGHHHCGAFGKADVDAMEYAVTCVRV
jgi:hypothetical protein